MQQNASERQWRFPNSALLSTPSVRLGAAPADEAAIRLRASKYIDRCARRLRLPRSLAAAAKLLLQRFYMRASFRDCDYHDVAAALIFLSSKLGDGRNFKRIEDVVSVCGSEAKKSPVDMSENSKEFLRWKDTIMYYEEYALEQLCFDISPELPHVHALEIVRGYNGSIALQTQAFLYCDEALCTTLAVRFSARQIAQAAVLASCLALRSTLWAAPGLDWISTLGPDSTKIKAMAHEIAIASDESSLRKLTSIRTQKLLRLEALRQQRYPDGSVHTISTGTPDSQERHA